LASEVAQHHRLCALNVIEQAANVGRTTVVRDAWVRGQTLTVHGWIYGVRDGLLQDLGMRATSEPELAACHAAACAALAAEQPVAADGAARCR
jgi:carbonic anhydrase